jgi:hypothetical protein
MKRGPRQKVDSEAETVHAAGHLRGAAKADGIHAGSS